ncbi:trypsin-like peptidase domain-containing protein [Lapillicoccus sp.]|uniref:trypsin-like serine peptidase n=1 Tax=Lapillicoccus sp. TaxID=1909287 RepID=UPI003264A9EA
MMAAHLRHRPLDEADLEVRADELSRTGPTIHTRLVTRVAGSVEPSPRVEVKRDGDGWKVDVEVPGAVAVPRPGLTVGTIERVAAPTARQLDASIPTRVAVSTDPEMTPLGSGPVKLSGRPGREYTPLLVTPSDGRHLLGSHAWPWNLTGLVTTSDGKAGSGVLIGDRLMLTAHHMRPSATIARGSWWMTFTPNFDSGNAPFGSSNVSDLRHYDSESDTQYIVGHDFMLCRLFEPMGQHLGFIGASTFDDDWRGMNVWSNVGYPIDVGGGQRPAVQTGQSMEDDYEDDSGQYIETEASLNHGNSGGPFFSWFTDGHVRLCSVVSGETSFNGDVDNVLAGGDDMINLISWGRANWPA